MNCDGNYKLFGKPRKHAMPRLPPHMKFRAPDPKSEAGLLLWNKYGFLMKWKKLVRICYFANRSGVNEKKKENILPG